VGELGDYAVDGELYGPPGESCFETTHRALPRRARVRIGHDRAAGVALMREACILEAVRHPGLPRVFEIGVDNGLPWIADELVQGEPLAGPLALGLLPGILRDACAILAQCHRRGVIHDGIWIDAFVRAPERGFPLCLVNWRRARVGDPEEGRDDVYALGMAIYAALPDSAPLGLMNLIGQMLDERPTAEEVANEATRLGEVAGGFEDPDIEEVILLTDLSRDPAPLTIPTKPKWTPAPAMAMTPSGSPIALLKPRP
jgi:hypothetical protein